MGRIILIVTFSMLAWTQSALACSYSGPLIDINWRVDYARDGSFRNGGDNNGTSGKAVFDLLEGRIGQVIVEQGACFYSESLLMADCNSLEMTVVRDLSEYPSDQEIIVNWMSFADALLPPDGLLGRISGQSVLEMRRFLVRNGAKGANDLLERNNDEEPRDQFNPFAGCKVLYPGSRGASYEWPKPTE